jgi:hypothetical protein
MKLKIGTVYRVYMPDGENTFSIFRLTVVSSEGDGWYKVESSGDAFFLNLNQAIRIYEEEATKQRIPTG